MDEPLLTVEQLAERLNVSTKTVYRLLKRGELPAHRIGGGWRFDRHEIGRWLFNKRLDQFRKTG